MAYPITKSDEAIMTTTLFLTGNVVPDIWLQRLVFDKSGKPQWLAVWILSDVCYWYTPTEVRDEQTGRVTGYAKKYKGDLLQRSYDDITSRTGCEKKQAQRACKLLEDYGLIKLHFRTLVFGGVRCANVMFIEPIVNRIKQLTYDEVWTSMEGGMDVSVHTYEHECMDGMDMGVHTNTITTTENTTDKSFASQKEEKQSLPDLSTTDLLSKPYTELQELCKSLGKDGHLVLVNYWYQLTGSKSPKLERSGQPTTAAKKFKANYATFLKDKTFLDDVFPALRDYALNIVPIKKDWPTLEWFLGTGKNNNGPGWKRVAEKQAWLYRPDEGKNAVPNKPDVKPLYYTP